MRSKWELTRNSRGFTLIEVMIVVAIVAILTAVALPAYTSYIQRGKIQEATTALLAQRTKMEQYFQDTRTYVGACAANTVAPLPAGLKFFGVACTNLTSTTYTVTAAGNTVGDASMNGFSFSIDEANARKTLAVPADWTLPATNCWVSKKGGVC